MDYSVALTAVGETVTYTDADCLAHYLLLNILVSLRAPHLRCKCAFIFYYFLFLLELTVLQLSLCLCTSSITMRTHFLTPSALREHSSFTFFIPWIHSPTFEWLFFFLRISSHELGTVFVCSHCFQLVKITRFPATWESFYSHWKPPKYISRYWLQLWTEPDIWLVRAPECGQRVSHSNHSALC